ncbi:MAG: LysR family transcriptional regulator [Proteobacteria bacterium]|nr:LysR family transcriptional regulator [Pseudomonadota bacterium]
MKKASLTLIQTFFVVAQDGSFSAAARKLNMSYQSAANHVRRLEQLIGERLVKSDQGAKTVALTERGSSLYRLLQPELETMLARLSFIVDKERPVIRIGLPQAYFYYLLPSILSAFYRIHPDVEVLAYERDTILSDLIKDGSLDVCMSERYFGDEVVPQHLICSFHLTLVYPRAWGAPPRPTDIAAWGKDRPFITYEPGQTLRNLALDFLKHDDREPHIAVSTSGCSSVKRCVKEGLGFAIIPSWCNDTQDKDIASVSLESALPKIPIYFGEASFLNANPYVQTLRRLCSEMIIARIDRRWPAPISLAS